MTLGAADYGPTLAQAGKKLVAVPAAPAKKSAVVVHKLPPGAPVPPSALTLKERLAALPVYVWIFTALGLVAVVWYVTGRGRAGGGRRPFSR